MYENKLMNYIKTNIFINQEIVFRTLRLEATGSFPLIHTCMHTYIYIYIYYTYIYKYVYIYIYIYIKNAPGPWPSAGRRRLARGRRRQDGPAPRSGAKLK